MVYAGRPFQVCINGVTGEVQGHRPFSKVKIAAAITLAVIIVIIVAVLYARSK